MFGLFSNKYHFPADETSMAEESIKTRSKYSGHRSTSESTESDRVKHTRERKEGKRF
jgi:hypothetical protein